uniref:Uncharacterized protein n=1 Tax=Myoviridae sp. ct0Tg8 TaxID=2826598 RepID=A0A8S5NCN7_9CAUD|nr:MAG TPA: hypothetical protein [Myoviridae sp. ct0Tg8]
MSAKILSIHSLGVCPALNKKRPGVINDTLSDRRKERS